MSGNRSRRDPNQIEQYEHNEEINAKRMELVGGEVSMELDADDGDSVQTQGRAFEYTNIVNDTPVSCIACSKINMYVTSTQSGATGNVQLWTSPDTSGDRWVQRATAIPSGVNNETVETGPLDILAQRMKVTGIDGDVEVKILGRG